MRILWVCDAALGLERHAGTLDWERMFAGSRFDTDRIRSLLATIRQLLGASHGGWPSTIAYHEIPSWLERALLEQWANADGYANEALAAFKSNPGSILRLVAERTSGPIQATVHLLAPFNTFPRLPIQCASYVLKLAQFPVREFPLQFSRYIRSSVF
jgi:hypothetical protein